MRNSPDPDPPEPPGSPLPRARARRSPNDPGRRARVRLRRNRASFARGAVEMGLWWILTAMLGGLASTLWRVAESRLAGRPLPLRLAFPGVAIVAMVFAAAQGWSVLRELRGLRAEQRRLTAHDAP